METPSAFKLLLLVNRTFGPSDIQRAVEGVTFQFRTDFQGVTATILDSASWWKQKFSQDGSWEAWIHNTVHGRDYSTRQPYFNGFVVCSTNLGKANAGIVRLALEARRVVLSWTADKPLEVLQELVLLNPNSWKDGWSFRTVPME